MKTRFAFRLLATTATLAMAQVAYAQSAVLTAPDKSPPGTAAVRGESPTRMQLKMDREEFLRTHEWNEGSGYWIMKDYVDVPNGVKPRSEVKAERDQFLRNNRFSVTDGWVPLQKPRDMSTLTRKEVRADTARFLTTHRWDEATSNWVDKLPRQVKR